MNPPGQPGDRRGKRDIKNPAEGGPGGKGAAVTAMPPAQPYTMTFDSLDNLRARSYFELGMIFMLDMGRIDSAEMMFHKVINDFGASGYLPRTMYSLAELYRVKNDSCGMDSLYRIIYADHKQTPYGKNLMPYFGEVVDTVETVDSLTKKYEAINILPDSANALKSLKQLQALSDSFPKTSVAAKSLFAMGWIYENILLNNDSAASVYKKLIEAFPTSDYTAVAQPKVAVKEKPESLSQYVKIKEIQAIPKPVRKDKEKKEGKEGDRMGGPPGEGNDQPGNSLRDRFKNRGLNNEENPDEENTDEENTDEGVTNEDENNTEDNQGGDDTNTDEGNDDGTDEGDDPGKLP